ncbi:DUF2867 domain-containing protein [Albibacillus kandeliae]|uniref:DUF2867 domain-containing protein n=1 Tax=Albibacillus kandeliae TaxID=2174228 RepID=UPI000D68DD0F|nr:DUF2867 domain-containing protein [Albibacillus kandeliae]
MPAVRLAPLPPDATLRARVGARDFLDGYAVETPLSAREGARLALGMPGWARALLRLRNALVRPFGLRTEAPAGQDAWGLFTVEKDSADEMIFGFDDRHLDFRITFVKRGERLHMGTWVHPHNIFGRLYLALVMPFHVLIVRNGMAGIARAAR